MAEVVVLPAAARRELVELAAAVLGELSESEVPLGLRKVRGFVPARRAGAGAGPLAVAVERDAAFRQRVAARWRVVHPELARSLDDAVLPAAIDPQAGLVGVYLLRPDGWPHLLQALLAAAPAAPAAPSALDPAEPAAELAPQLALEVAQQLAPELARQLAREQATTAALREESAAIQRELRRLRADADRARAAARADRQERDAERERSAQVSGAAEAAVAAAVRRAEDAEERLAQARRVAREGRSLADSRVRLLLDAVLDAGAGLRRELALPPVSVRPADVVVAELRDLGAAPGGGLVEGTLAAAAGGPGFASLGLPAEDPALLVELLSVPQCHLLVDGYNVTKTGFGTLPLIEQRRRLVDALAALAVRTSCEVTCCFDGAAAEPAAGSVVRGVRVLFSVQGMTADELIRRLVRAEPPGRAVVVVSSDAEVASGVRAHGARAVPAQALLRLLYRGQPGRGSAPGTVGGRP